MKRGANAPAREGMDERSSRDHLLDAASAAMIEEGTADVSLHAIARKAGLTAPLVTYHFGSKEGLLLALARRDTNRSLEQLQELVAMTVPPEKKLRIHISGIIRNYAKRPYLNGLLNLLLRDETSETARIIKETFVAPLALAQRTIIEEGIAAGRFRRIDSAMAYFVIIGACQYFFSNRITVRHILEGEADEAAVERYAQEVVDVVLNGLFVR